jgi:hypothetical protein
VCLRSVLQFLVTANVLSSQILVTVMMEAIPSSEASVPTRATRRNIPENDILLNFIYSRTRLTELWIRESDISGNYTSQFHCIDVSLKTVQRQTGYAIVSSPGLLLDRRSYKTVR